MNFRGICGVTGSRPPSPPPTLFPHSPFQNLPALTHRSRSSFDRTRSAQRESVTIKCGNTTLWKTGNIMFGSYTLVQGLRFDMHFGGLFGIFIHLLGECCLTRPPRRNIRRRIRPQVFNVSLLICSLYVHCASLKSFTDNKQEVYSVGYKFYQFS